MIRPKEVVRKTSVESTLPPMRPASDRAQQILRQLDAAQSLPSTSPPAPEVKRRSSQDEKSVDDLRKKVESQRTELDCRTDSVNAIQRNFQRLSEMYSSDRQKLIVSEAEVVRLTDELAALRTEKKLFVALQTEFASLQEEHRNAIDCRESERTQHEMKVKKLEELVRISERDNKAMSLSLNKIVRESQERVEDSRRVNTVIEEIETTLDSLLLSAMEFQKEFVEASDSDFTRCAAMKAVGKGIAFVGSNRPGQIQDSAALRLEVVSASMQSCSQDCFASLKDIHLMCFNGFKNTIEKSEHCLAQEVHAHRVTREEVSRLQVAVEAAVARAAKIEQQFALERASLSMEVDSLKREGDDKLQTSAQANAVAFNALNERVAIAEAHLLEKSQECSKLLEITRQLEVSRDLESQEVARLSALNHNMKAALDSAKKECETEAHLKDKFKQTVSQLQAEISRLQTATARHNQLVTANSEKDLLSKLRIGELEKTIDELNGELQSTLSNRAVIQNEYESSCVQLAEMKKSDSEKEIRLQKLADHHDVLTCKCKEQEVQLTEVMAERSQLLMDAHTSEENLMFLNSQLAESRGAALKLRNERALQESDIQRLQEEVSRLSDSNRGIDSFRLRNQQQADEIADLKNAMINASALAQLNQEKILQLSKALSLSDMKVASTMRELDVLQEAQKSLGDERHSLDLQRKAAEAHSLRLREAHEETLKTVKKLIHVEKACESGYSCLGCLQLLKDPVLCAPCGHTFCRRCFEEDSHNRDRKSQGRYCPECDEHNVTLLVPSKSLDLLTGKFQYRCQVLADLCSNLEGDV